jgi:alginate O-acetyltransferase complex protein AlgI
MVFSSLVFLYLFLPLNLLIYFALRREQHRNLVLIVFSFVFYAWGEPVWISLLLLSATVDWVHGLLIERWRGTARARLVLLSSLTINLGILGIFKYSGFLYEQINAVLGTQLTPPEFALPIGISFYTFQTVSYVVDVYRGKLEAQRSYTRFLMFVSLYPQLVAGPIVRYADIAKQIDHRTHSLADASQGITRFCIGLFKKVCIANVAGELVARYMDADLSTLSVSEAWFGLFMFALQIYFDFSGYSDMAIGLGRIFGFHYPENFNHPYIAKTAGEFWRRWHMTLSRFFRDYVYIPLGGKKRHPYRNLFIVWFLTGLWHGASWNFVLWGLYFGFLILLERLFLRRLLAALPAFVSHGYLLFAVLMGWTLFYFEDSARLFSYCTLLFGGTSAPMMSPDLPSVVRQHLYWLILALALCMPTAQWLRARFLDTAFASPRNRPVLRMLSAVVNLALLLLPATALLVGQSYNPFLYFRF